MKKSTCEDMLLNDTLHNLTATNRQRKDMKEVYLFLIHNDDILSGGRYESAKLAAEVLLSEFNDEISETIEKLTKEIVEGSSNKNITQ